MPPDGFDFLALQEFRLHAPDADGVVARMVATASRPSEGAVPLLTSVDDRRDVATLRAVSSVTPNVDPLREDRALGRLVATWQPVRRYLPRLAERSDGTASSFHLAVTESGINDEPVAPPSTWLGEISGESSGERIALLWIGSPEGTHAGLLVLVGRDEEVRLAGGPDHPSWPLPLSRDLGVRVYKSGPRVRARAEI